MNDSSKEIVTYDDINDIALDIRTTRILIGLGVPTSCKGYEYIRRSIILTYHTPEITCYITKTLYPQVARVCRASNAANVERNCRHAIESACRSSHTAELREYFGYDVTVHRPTCAQFISTIAKHLHET
ncbi:MAG: sporulation initiation factor Spo0A C-terminal domain-containing protein [Clostridia bacterium]|nr:sporulation initiation factor Spo0A C-terminal domain-containing protein [Clostridia bacterium]